jgi:hypothetical protein
MQPAGCLYYARRAARKPAQAGQTWQLGGDEPYGTMVWSRNGFTTQMTFEAGYPAEQERCASGGGSCVTLWEKTPSFRLLDGSTFTGTDSVGNAASVSAGATQSPFANSTSRATSRTRLKLCRAARFPP